MDDLEKFVRQVYKQNSDPLAPPPRAKVARPRPPIVKEPAPVAPKVGAAGAAAGSRAASRIAPWLLMLDGPEAGEGEDAMLEKILGSGPMGPLEQEGPKEQEGPANHQGIMEEFEAHDSPKAPKAKKMRSLEDLKGLVRGREIRDKLKYEDRVDERLELRNEPAPKKPKSIDDLRTLQRIMESEAARKRR